MELVWSICELTYRLRGSKMVKTKRGMGGRREAILVVSVRENN